MEPTYRTESDGLQWILYREADSEKKKDGKATGEMQRMEKVVGYFPKFHQCIARMYECMLRDKVGSFDEAGIAAAVRTATEIFEGLNAAYEAKQ